MSTLIQSSKQIHSNECNLDVSPPAGLQSLSPKEREQNHPMQALTACG